MLNESIYVLVKLKEKKLSHLDIKPCNILIKKLDDGYTTKFSDFGTARQNTGTIANTLARGTLIYMSPELKQICDGNTSGMGEFNPELADVFSLGITFLRFVIDISESEI